MTRHWRREWKWQGSTGQRMAQRAAVGRGWEIGLCTGIVTGALATLSIALFVTGWQWMALASGVVSAGALVIGYERARTLVRRIFRS